MKYTNLFNSRHQNDECECVARCECGKASDIYIQYAAEYFAPTTIETSPALDDLSVEEFDGLFETDDKFFELFGYEFEKEFIDDGANPVDAGPFQTPEKIEQRKSELKGTKYFHNEFAIANCHLVQVEVAFKNKGMKDILSIVAEGTDDNFEILELRDHFVVFIAHFEPKYYIEDDILNYLHKIFGHEIYSLVYISYL